MTAKPKHTPGPWSIASEDQVDFEVLGGHKFGVRVATEVSEPDAHLIAAAPVMREALKATLLALEAHVAEAAERAKTGRAVYCPCGENEIKQARAVLRLADGEDTPRNFGPTSYQSRSAPSFGAKTP